MPLFILEFLIGYGYVPEIWGVLDSKTSSKINIQIGIYNNYKMYVLFRGCVKILVEFSIDCGVQRSRLN